MAYISEWCKKIKAERDRLLRENEELRDKVDSMIAQFGDEL